MVKKGVHVAVAVIVKDGRILISKRAKNVHQGGLWEFPGGKVEAGEAVAEALCREIKEELGINVKKSRPLIKLVHHYPDKSVILETRMVTGFDGKEYAFDTDKQEQFGLEGQQVKWVPLEQLENYKCPRANQAIINALNLPETYLITPDCESEAEPVKQFIKQFSTSIQAHEHCRNHCLVQIRIPSFIGNRGQNKGLLELVQQLCEIARVKNVQLLANSSLCLGDEFTPSDRDKSAVQANIMELTTGIHLTSFHLHEPFLCEDGMYKEGFIKNYRQHFPEKKIAASCHCKKDIERANQLKLDFIVVSPVQHTASHPNQKSLGWKQFKALADIAQMPVFALGGMASNDIEQAQNNGAQGISAIRSLWDGLK